MTTEITPQAQALPRRTESGMQTRSVNAAAGVLLAAMEQGRQTPTGLAIALDAACLLNSPEHAAEFAQLREQLAEFERPADEDPIAFTLTAAAEQLPQEPAADQPLTVYRASHDSIVMGLYTTPEAARAHCEAEERRANSSEATFDWIEDEEDGVSELVAETVLGEESTGYVVTALKVAAAYDEEADE